ncbi:MAG: FtsX-like permease family protein [Bacteroidota bacterium]
MKGLENWRNELWRAGLEPGDIEELEDHLINRMEDYVDQGNGEEEAFELARQDLSINPQLLARAYVEGRKRRRFRWMSVSLSSIPLSLYYKVALRTFQKNKIYALLNVVGLAVSVAAAFLVGRVVHHETTYDRSYPDAHRIYRVVNAVTINGERQISSDVGQPVGPTLVEEFPQVTEATRVRRIGLESHLEVGKVSWVSQDVFVADAQFFRVFQRQFLRGNPDAALTEPNTMVISEDLALKLFGHIDVVDSFLSYSSVMPPMQMKITGVLAALDGPTHLPFEALVAYPTYFRPKGLNNWLRKSYTYLKLSDDDAIDRLSSQVSLFNERYMTPAYKKIGGTAQISFQPLSDIYLDPPHQWEPYPHGNRSDVLALQVLMTFLLLMAAINYVNLSTASTVDRLHTIAIKKTLGASKLSLVVQFLVESALLAGSAGILGLALAFLFAPQVEVLSGVKLQWVDSWQQGVMLVSGAVALGLLSGVYPGVQMAKDRGQDLYQRSSATGGLSRRSLIIFQYFVSSVLLIGICVVFSQVYFLKNKDVGFQEDSIVQVSAPRAAHSLSRFPSFMAEVGAIPSVRGVSISEQPLDRFRAAGSQMMVGPDGAPIRTAMAPLFVGEAFFRSIGAKVKTGRGFDRDRNNDWTFLINEEAASTYGWQGQELTLKWRDDGSRGVAKTWRCIGVVEDIVLGEAYREGLPMMICYDNKARTNSKFFIGLNGPNVEESLLEIGAVWDQHFPGVDFLAEPLSDRLEALYLKEDVFMKFLLSLGSIAVLITVLGIFGLIHFATSRRKKEIALRKIHGAGVRHLVKLLSGDFILLLICAVLGSIPCGLYLSQRWLASFEVHIHLQLWHFLAPIPVCLLFTAVGLYYHIRRAARTNPIEAIRYE